MALLKDMFEVDSIIEGFEKIKTPEQLLEVVQKSQDVFDKYISFVKKVPSDLARWEDTLKNMDILIENSNIVSSTADKVFDSINTATKGTILEGKLGLENLISSKNKEKQTLGISIGDIKVDYINEIKPKYTTTTESQPIISMQNIDRLNEHAENENTTYKLEVALRGEDAETRFKQINALRSEKRIIRVVGTEVYDQCLITGIERTIDNKNGVVFEITLENIYIAQLKRTANRYVPKSTKVGAKKDIVEKVAKTDPAPIVEPPKPVTPQQKPTLTAKELYKENTRQGVTTPARYKKRSSFGIRR